MADSHGKSVSNRLALCNQRDATAAMTDDTPLPFDLPALDRKKLTVDFNGGTQSSDAGLLREVERKLGVRAGRRILESRGLFFGSWNLTTATLFSMRCIP